MAGGASVDNGCAVGLMDSDDVLEVTVPHCHNQ
jgi:hypothetical protein